MSWALKVVYGCGDIRLQSLVDDKIKVCTVNMIRDEKAWA